MLKRAIKLRARDLAARQAIGTWATGLRPPPGKVDWNGLPRRPYDLSDGVILVLGLALALITGYLVVVGWKVALVALGLQLALPIAILIHRYPFLGLLLWLAFNQFLLTTEFLLPYRVAFWLFHRAIPPLTVGVMVLSAMVRINRRTLPQLGLPELAMAGYLAVSLLSIVLLSNSPLATSYRLYDRVFIPMCLYLIARLSIASKRDFERLVAVAGFVCVMQALTGLISWVRPDILPLGWRSQVGARTIGSLINTSTYTSTLIFCGLLLLIAALRQRRGFVRTLYLALFALALGFTFLSFSRASWLGALLVLLGLIFLYPAFMARLGLIAAPLLTIILSIGVFSHYMEWASERLYSEDSKGSALDRLPAFVAALRMFEAKPLFGWGYQNFERYDRRFQGRVLDLGNDNKDHANHNAYLTILAEQGLIGLGLYIATPLLLLARSLRVQRQLPADGLWSRKLLVLLWLAIINIVVQNSFTPAWVTYGLGLWWLILGLIAVLVYRVQPVSVAYEPAY